MSHLASRARMPAGISSTARARSGGSVSLLERRLFRRSIFRAIASDARRSPNNGKRRNTPLKSTKTPYHLADFLLALLPSARFSLYPIRRNFITHRAFDFGQGRPG